MNTFLKVGAIAALTLAAASANATTIKSNYTVNANKTDPGLKVGTTDHADNPFTFDLNAGESTTFALFDIWTDEGAVNGDDRVGKRISVDFDFLLPESGASTTSGETVGTRKYFGLYHEGRLTWDQPADFIFGPNDDGQIRISLSNETFNEGYFGLNDHYGHGSTVDATLSLISDASAADVPEPSVLGLFTFALLGLGFASSRGRRANRG